MNELELLKVKIRREKHNKLNLQNEPINRLLEKIKIHRACKNA